MIILQNMSTTEHPYILLQDSFQDSRNRKQVLRMVSGDERLNASFEETLNSQEVLEKNPFLQFTVTKLQQVLQGDT